MLGRVTKKFARHILSVEWLEDRRLLSASLLGAAVPLLEAAPMQTASLVAALVQPPRREAAVQPSAAPPLSLSSTAEHAVAQISAVAVALVNSTLHTATAALPAVVADLPIVEAVPINVGVAINVPSLLPEVLPEVQVAAQITGDTSQTPSGPGVQLELGVSPTPIIPTPVTVQIGVPATPDTPVTLPVTGPVSVGVPGNIAVPISGNPAPTPVTGGTGVALLLPQVVSNAISPVSQPKAAPAALDQAATALAAQPAAGTAATQEFTPTAQLLDAVFGNAAAMALAVANVNAPAAAPTAFVPVPLSVPTRLLLPTSGSSEAVAGNVQDLGLPLAALRTENVPAFVDLNRADNPFESDASPQLLDLLAEAHPSDATGLEQAALHLLGQFRALQQQFGDLLAGLGMYHWLLGAALGAAACALYARQQRRKAADADAELRGAPEFAFLDEGRA